MRSATSRLEHQNGGIVPRRPGLDAEPGDQQGRRDVVRKVGDNARRAAVNAAERIEGECIRLHDVETAGIVRRDLMECRDGASILLDGNYALGAECEQRAGETTRTGTDLEDGDAREHSGRAGDACGKIEVEQEVLSERFPCDELMAADDLAQRRQVIQRIAHGVTRRAGASAAASRAARRSAATRLVGSARPLPAMSKAVPWSGEVRTKGNPSVTLTA